MNKQRLKWEDVGSREYLEVTTEEMGYHWTKVPTYLASAGQAVGTQDRPWVAEFKTGGRWQFIGEFRTGREARRASIEAHQAAAKQLEEG